MLQQAKVGERIYEEVRSLRSGVGSDLAGVTKIVSRIEVNQGVSILGCMVEGPDVVKPKESVTVVIRRT